MCFTYNLVNEFIFAKMEMQQCSTKPSEWVGKWNACHRNGSNFLPKSVSRNPEISSHGICT